MTCACGCKSSVIVASIFGNKVRLLFEAPDKVTINRREIQEQVDRNYNK